MIAFSCPSCGESFSVKEEFAGRKTKCRKCSATIRVPATTPPPLRPEKGRKSAPSRPDAGPADDTLTHIPVATLAPTYKMRGVQDELEVFEDKLTITPKGVLGFLNKGMKGTKHIPFASITAIQFKEAGAVFSGYLQFTIPGGNESRGGIFAATKDENTFMFARPDNNALAVKIKDYIESAVHALRTPSASAPPTRLSEELQNLAKLKQQGILSEEEFRAAKKKLIG